MHDLTRAKQRLKSFLLRQGLHYPGKASWSAEHQRYLRALQFPIPSLRAVLEEYLFAFDQIVQRVQRLEELLEVHVPQWRMYPAVQALMCMRGFRLTAAAMLVAELGDIRAPTLIIAGAADTSLPPRFSREMHSLIAGSELVELPGAGHSSPIEDPDGVTRALREFLAAHPGAPGQIGW